MTKDKGQDYYENKLDEYRKRNVTQNNFVDFLRDINNTISEADSAIEQLQIEKQRKTEQLDETINEFGEDELDDLRSKGQGRWNLDLYQLGRTKDNIIDLLEDLRDRERVRGDLLDVKARQVIPILEQLDAEQIRAQVYEQMNELTEKRIENAEERLNGRLDNLESKLETVQSEFSRQVRDVRESSRRERSDNATELLEFMDKVITRLDHQGVKTDDLEQHKKNLSQGEEVDSVEIGVDAASSSLEGTMVDPGEDNNTSSDSGGQKSEKKRKIEQALRELEQGSEKYNNQGDIAEAFDVSDGRVSQIKSEME